MKSKPRCRAYRLTAQDGRHISPWSHQCPHPAKGEVEMRDRHGVVVLPACGRHIRLHENGLRSVHVYHQTSERYEFPAAETMA